MSSLYGNNEDNKFSIVVHSCFELKLLALWKLRPYYSL